MPTIRISNVVQMYLIDTHKRLLHPYTDCEYYTIRAKNLT